MNDERDNPNNRDNRNNPNAAPTPEEQTRLRALPREMTPPAGLEDEVAGVLRTRGLLRDPVQGTSNWTGLLGLAAPALAMLLVGFLAGGWWAGKVPAGPANVTGQPRFVLLLRNPPAFHPDLPREELRRQYGTWAAEKIPAGAFLAGEELAETGWQLNEAGETAALGTTEGGTEPAGAVSGFFLIQTENSAAALAIARTIPHLRHGGVVELREIAGGN